jgi:maltose alpha-D-glucosyltransferase/alpha-amylase
MIRIRKEHSCFGVGIFQFELPDNDAVLAYWRAHQREKVLVVVNLTDERQDVTFSLGIFTGHQPVDLLTGETFPEITSRDYTLNLPPYAFYWLLM